MCKDWLHRSRQPQVQRVGRTCELPSAQTPLQLLRCKAVQLPAKILAPGGQAAFNSLQVNPSRTAMRLTTATPSFARACSRPAILIILSAVLFAPNVQAQPAIPEAPTATSVQPAATFSAPKYSSADIDRAFGFMDSNKDVKSVARKRPVSKMWPDTSPQPIPTKTNCCRAVNLRAR